MYVMNDEVDFFKDNVYNECNVYKVQQQKS
jgi:hypothetical protein